MTGKLSEGSFSIPKAARFAVVAARFNDFIVDALVEGALTTLREHGVEGARLELVRVPGAFELPVLCKKLAESGEYAAIITLGCVIRGATAHFEYVAGGAATGLMQVAVTTGVPIIFGVLTTETARQAVERASANADNKGREAALCALEMASLMAERGAPKPRTPAKRSKPVKPAAKRPAKKRKGR
jgi:6,7-dimethyl-8-ribityllumazine synthase